MTKKADNILGLVPFGSSSMDLSPSAGALPFGSSRELTRDEQRVLDQFYKKRLIIDLTGDLTELSELTIGEIHEQTAATFEATVSYIETLRNQPHGKEHQAYLDA